MRDIEILKIVYSYVSHQIDPQKSIPLDYLAGLNISDIDAISEDMFEETVYTKEDVKFMLKELSKVIIKLEKNEKGTD
jgi:hypothetical protein